LTTWTGNPSKGREISASLADWIDMDSDVRPLGAEAPSYVALGYSPRNGGLGNADLFLIKGMEPGYLVPAIVEVNKSPAVRGPLLRFISGTPSGPHVNPNYASRPVLESVPGMNQQLLQTILQTRRNSVFTDAQDFQQRTGASKTTSILDYLIFNRGTTPAVTAIARLSNSGAVHVERRVRRRTQTARFLTSIEHGWPAE